MISPVLMALNVEESTLNAPIPIDAQTRTFGLQNPIQSQQLHSAFFSCRAALLQFSKLKNFYAARVEREAVASKKDKKCRTVLRKGNIIF
jgi:hypothetical protein